MARCYCTWPCGLRRRNSLAQAIALRAASLRLSDGEPEPEAIGGSIVWRGRSDLQQNVGLAGCAEIAGRVRVGIDQIHLLSIHGLFHLGCCGWALQLYQQRSHVAMEDRRLNQIELQRRQYA